MKIVMSLLQNSSGVRARQLPLSIFKGISWSRPRLAGSSRIRVIVLQVALATVLTLISITIPAMASTQQHASVLPIVQIKTTFQKDNPYYPWQKQQPGTRAGFGVVIDDSHILTTENLVRNHTLIEIQLPHSGKNITATLVKSDYQVNLALLHIENNLDLKNIVTPLLAKQINLKSTVSIIQIDETKGIQRGDGHIVKALVESLPNAASGILQYDILTDLNVTGEGAPVFINNKLAGIMISYRSGSRTGKMIPATFITRFINDVMSESYNGFASAGFRWSPLVDPTKRKYLGVDTADNGIQILSCLPGTGAAKNLKPNDVILTWDGILIDNLGFYIDENYGRVLFSHLIKGFRSPNDIITATIVRDRKVQQIQITLARRNESTDLIPENSMGLPSEYIVTGGLIIQELTGQMLHAYGPKWQSRVNPRLAHLYLTKQQNPDKPGDRIVLLTSVLDDPINIGYQDFRNKIIKKVNGKPICNISDVFDIIKTDGNIKTISLQSIGVDIVLDQNELDSANHRIAVQYRIPELQRKIETSDL